MWCAHCNTCPQCADLRVQLVHANATLDAVRTLLNIAPAADCVALPAPHSPPTDMDILDEAFEPHAMASFLDAMQASEHAARAFVARSKAQRERMTVEELRRVAEQLQLPYLGTKHAMLATLVRVATQVVRAAEDGERFMRSMTCVAAPSPP